MRPMHASLRYLAILLLLAAGTARADVLLLVHGWASDADTWRHSGVVAVLQSAGWRDAGIVGAGPAGVMLFATRSPPTDHTLYTAQLPAEAPIPLQADLLDAELQYLSTLHPREPIVLVGHSAGALVARFVLVTRQPAPVKALISIAAPNLGTPRAVQGLRLVDDKPFFCPGPGIDLLKQFVGGDDYRYLRNSRAALLDMTPHALSGWLNAQPHPDIRYLSIVHQLPGNIGDNLVPAHSQDLNQVAVLHGRAQTRWISAPHGLGPADGQLITQFLANNID